MAARRAFTLLETLMVILVIGIIAVITIPRFIDLRLDANNAKYEGCRAGMRSAVAMYYARSSLPEYDYLCTTTKTDPAPNNTYRDLAVTAPCYPASCDEIKSLIVSMGCDVDCSCYDPNTGQVIPCG